MTLLGLFASLCGFFISFYIYKKKHTKQKLMCPRNTDCDTVIHSRHGTTFGISTEIWGIFYYLFLGIVFVSIPLIPVAYFSLIQTVLIGIVLLGMLFSVYLITIQAVIIRAWCLWCLGSAVVNVALVYIVLSLPDSLEIVRGYLALMS